VLYHDGSATKKLFIFWWFFLCNLLIFSQGVIIPCSQGLINIYFSICREIKKYWEASKMIKKTISLLLVFMMVFTIAIPSNAYATGKDYAGHWAEETIQLWLDKGNMTGYPDGTFKPEAQVTRAEFVTMVNNLFDYSETSAINFTDVSANDWYYQEVQKAFKAGYMAGLSETQFAPNDNLTREQAATIVSRIAKLEGDVAAADIFTDKNKISNWALALVGAAAKAEIIKGYDDNSFRPQNPITRAEAVVTLDRISSKTDLSDLIIDKAGIIVENKTVRNLHITKAVGNGDVTLKNVTVTGELLVEGGGQNSIIIENSTIHRLTANKEDGKVRILITGDTAVTETSILSGVTLEQEGLTGTGFEEVTIDENANESQTITVKANLGTLSINAKIKVNVVTGEIESIIIEKTAEGASINLSEDAKVLLVAIDVKVSFTGTGTIISATINVNEVSFEQEPDDINLAPGINGPDIISPSLGGGGGGGSPVESIPVSAINVTGAGNAVAILSGGTLQMSAAITPANATNKTVTWSVTTLDKVKATIDETGLLIAEEGYGSVTVAAINSASGVTGTKVIDIVPPMPFPSVNIGEQNGTIFAKADGQSATYDVTTLLIADNQALTINGCTSEGAPIGEAGSDWEPGLHVSGSNVSSNASTITAVASHASAGTYYFKATIAGVTSNLVTLVVTPAVNVSAINVTGEGGAIAVLVNNTLQMYAAVTADNATNKTVTWSVATVTGGAATIDASSGLLTATSVGSIQVSATAQDGSGIIGTYNLMIANSIVTSDASIQAAIVAAKDGDTVFVAAGTYYEELKFKDKNSVTLIGAGQEKTIIAPTRAYIVGNNGITIDNSNYITVSDLTIDGFGNASLAAGSNFRDGVYYLNNGDNNTFKRLTVKNVDRRGISAYPVTTVNTTIEDCTIDNITIANQLASDIGAGTGIMLNGTGVVKNNIIKNTYHGVAGNSSVANGTITIEGNTMSFEKSTFDRIPGRFSQGIELWPQQSETVVIKNNSITSNVDYQYGIYLNDHISSGSAITGNTITLNGDYGTGVECVNSNLNGYSISYNRITAGDYSTGLVMSDCGTAASVMRVIDNTFVNSGTIVDSTFTNLYSIDYYIGYEREIGIIISSTISTKRVKDTAIKSIYVEANGNTINGFKEGIALVAAKDSFNSIHLSKFTGNIIKGYETIALSYGNYDSTNGYTAISNSDGYGEIDLSHNYWGSTNPSWDTIVAGAKVNCDPWYSNEAMTTLVSSKKLITKTTLGTLEGGNITAVPAGTTVSVLKDGLTVSDLATVEILVSTGGVAVAEQATTSVTATMKIKVTAKDGSTAEYTIAMQI